MYFHLNGLYETNSHKNYFYAEKNLNNRLATWRVLIYANYHSCY